MCVYIRNTHNGILLSHIKEWNILPFAATFMDLEMIILNKVSKTKRNIFLMCENKKKKKETTNVLIYKTEIDSQR